MIDGIELFDIYRGGQVLEAHKSLAYSIRYRAGDRTLTDGKVEEIQRRVLDSLKDGVGAQLRTG